MQVTSITRNAPSEEVVHQFARLQSMTQWWHWLVLLVVCAAVTSFVIVIYYRDAFEMTRAKKWTLVFLRLAALVGVLVFFLDLEKRSQRQVTKDSRVAVLVDTSLSMGIQDGEGSPGARARRMDEVVEGLSKGTLAEDLQDSHDVVFYRFGGEDSAVEIGSFERAARAGGVEQAVDPSQELEHGLVEARSIAAIAATCLGIAVLGLLIHFAMARPRRGDDSWGLLVGMVGFIAAGVIFAVANLRQPEISFLATIGLAAPQLEPPERESGSRLGDADMPPAAAEAIDWNQRLVPRGAETRLGDAVRSVVRRERDGSLAAVVVITDGGNNAGIEVERAAALAKTAQIPIHAIGVGSANRPANARVVDVEAPARVYPGDSFTLNAFVQAFGLAGRSVKVTLRSADADDEEASALMELEEERMVPLPEDGAILPLRFQVLPREPGHRRFEIQLQSLPRDGDPRDNRKSAKVRIVERKNQVLLLAGGPSREYRFLRDLLYRDRETTLHVLLQSGLPGMSQESDRLLDEFPTTTDELFEYDCILAFDPDWQALGGLAVGLLERWVSEEAGGLVVVAGPVHTPGWVGGARTDPLISTIRALYPVVFYSRSSPSLELGRFSSDTPWPLEFTADGRDAEFLWLGDDAADSEQAWGQFSGVYGYYTVKGAKPGARVYSRFSDPSTRIDGELPVYHAGHFYGAGRVFFQASGEVWRVRAIEDSLFEQYYTKLIRWVSQGRLLRDSSRGVLLVDKARCVIGDHIAVRTILSDARHEPLTAQQVTATLVDPDGQRSPLVLHRLQDATRDGMYAAQFVAARDGDYRIELQPPHGDDGELLVQEVRARIPAKETEHPERNDVLLKDLADQTGGRYYVGFAAAAGDSTGGETVPEETTLAALIQPQDQVSYVSGTPDRQFERTLMGWLMAIVCAALSLEWLIRRLSRLA